MKTVDMQKSENLEIPNCFNNLEQLLNDVMIGNKDLEITVIRCIEKEFQDRFQQLEAAEADRLFAQGINCAKAVFEWKFSTPAIISALFYDILNVQEMEALKLPRKMISLFRNVKKVEEEIETAVQESREDLLRANDSLNNLINTEGFFVYLFVLYQRLLETKDLEQSKVDYYINQLRLVTPLLEENKIFGWFHKFEAMSSSTPEKLKQLETYREKYYRLNHRYCMSTLEHFKELSGDGGPGQMAEETNRHSNNVVRCFYERRSPYSILREVEQESESSQSFDTKIQKKNMAYYDITILFDAVTNTPVEDFFQLYQSYLVDYRLCIIQIKKSSVSQTQVLVVKDDMGNLYRVFVETEFEYYKYYFGSVADKNGKFVFSEVDKSRDRICIHMRDAKIRCLDKGTTILDCAFILHGEKWGLHYASAEVNGKRVEKSYILQEGDTVEIQKDSTKVTAEIGWFKYLNTIRAKEVLIKHFKTQYRL